MEAYYNTFNECIIALKYSYDGFLKHYSTPNNVVLPLKGAMIVYA